MLRNATTGEVLAVSDPNDRGAAIFDSKVLTARTYDGMKFTITNPVIPEPVRTEWLDNVSNGRGTSTPRTTVTVGVFFIKLVKC